MIEEMQALELNHTQEIVPLPLGKNPVGCLWVFTIKVGPIVDCLEVHFVVKGITQIFGQDNGDAFSPIAKMDCLEDHFVVKGITQI